MSDEPCEPTRQPGKLRIDYDASHAVDIMTVAELKAVPVEELNDHRRRLVFDVQGITAQLATQPRAPTLRDWRRRATNALAFRQAALSRVNEAIAAVHRRDTDLTVGAVLPAAAALVRELCAIEFDPRADALVIRLHRRLADLVLPPDEFVARFGEPGGRTRAALRAGAVTGDLLAKAGAP